MDYELNKFKDWLADGRENGAFKGDFEALQRIFIAGLMVTSGQVDCLLVGRVRELASSAEASAAFKVRINHVKK